RVAAQAGGEVLGPRQVAGEVGSAARGGPAAVAVGDHVRHEHGDLAGGRGGGGDGGDLFGDGLGLVVRDPGGLRLAGYPLLDQGGPGIIRVGGEPLVDGAGVVVEDGVVGKVGRGRALRRGDGEPGG